MHATIQPGGRSPKPMNGPTSTSQLKPGSDSVLNSASSFPSQGKGKKRERGDQGSEPVKRERTSKMDDGDSGYGRPEINLKSEIGKITEKGGLEDSEGVEKLVQLMVPERNEKKMDLVSRSMLAGVIAATDKFDCLSQFVQLRGLPVFDEWLQEVHKGKIGDGSGSKDDRSIDDFLLTLLRALDKLPVNLTALQMCNIGKSVNHLRSHKNIEIQKKARSLVDTWKKRVEAEMDAKSGSNQTVPWSARPRISEAPQSGNKHSGSSEVAMKSSATQLSVSKTGSGKLAQVETAIKSASASPGSMKAVTSPASGSANLKDVQARSATVVGTSDPQTTARDEKSSSSSQSHNNSQSCSSDHVKTGGVPVKEDARSSVAGSGTVTKISGNTSRHRKSINGFPGPSGAQRETGSGKNSSLHRNLASEKISQSGLTCEKAADAPIAEGNSHKFIVKIPNRGRSPAQSVSGGSLEDHPVMNSRASSPVLSEKHEQLDRNMKEKSDTYRANALTDVNADSWQSNDFKDMLTGSDEGDGSPTAVPDEENCKSGEDIKKTTEVTRTASSSSGNELKPGKLQEASFISINALIDSCVKYSEANACMPVGDDAGMNLLASVAAGEISKSEVASPIDSPQRNTPVVEHSSTGNDTKVKHSAGDDIVRDRNQSVESADDEHMKQAVVACNSWAKNADCKTVSSNEKNGEVNEHLTSSMGLPLTVDSCLGSGKLKEIVTAALVNLPSGSIVEKGNDIGGSKEHMEKKAGGVDDDCSLDTKQKGNSSAVIEDKVINPVVQVDKEVVEGSSSVPSIAVDVENKKNVAEGLDGSSQAHQKSPAVIGHSAKGTDKEALPPGSVKETLLENVNEVKAGKDVETDASSHASHNEKKKPEWETFNAQKGEHVEENLENSEGHELCAGPVPCKASPTAMEIEQPMRPRGSKLTGAEADEAEEQTSTATDAPAAGVADTDAKVEFDLNEGFIADEGKYGEPNNWTAPGCSAPVQLISPLAFPVSSVSSSLPASITVAAAAKGPFVPPDDLLRTKGALGWKGSAATSAFRPAEPRKTLDMPLGTGNASISEATIGKQSRPPLDIDLNVPDERVLEDLAARSSIQSADSAADLSTNRDLTCGLVGSASIRTSGGLDLDLNRVDEPADLGNHSTGNSRRLDVAMQPMKSSSGGILNGEASVCRDFDLNNGPAVDEVSAEPSLFSQHNRSSNLPSQPPVSSLRINNTEIANFSSWFPTGNTYSAVTIPSILPDREQPFPIVATGGPQRLLGPPTGATPFNPDVYRGPVLTSSAAVPFPSTPFQYPVFPFGTTFPLPSTSFSGGSTAYVDSSPGGRLGFPPVNTQLLGSASAVPSHFARPYVVSLPDGSNSSGAESGRKWGRQGLDLNAGPGGPDIEGRDETTPLVSRQLSVASSQALAEEQARMYQVPGGILKRREPEGGWDGYKQSSWQ
ncbi:hypothetical protein DITRI_Ditri03aG0120800 [Diplodiscus trichospermus]